MGLHLGIPLSEGNETPIFAYLHRTFAFHLLLCNKTTITAHTLQPQILSNTLTPSTEKPQRVSYIFDGISSTAQTKKTTENLGCDHITVDYCNRSAQGSYSLAVVLLRIDLGAGTTALLCEELNSERLISMDLIYRKSA